MAEEAATGGARERLRNFLDYLPAVKKPEGHVHFRKKLMWTFAILLLYFVLANVPLFGLSSGSIDLFHQFRAFFAGESGSIITLGISPIVTAGILLQLLVGAKVVDLDMTNEDDKRLFQGLQKLAVFVLIAVETLPQIYGRFIRPDELLALQLGAPIWTLELLLFIQIALGSTLLLFMDEVVAKYGIGSGVSLFIVAGVAQQMFNGLFNFWDTQSLTLGAGQVLQSPVGLVPRWIWMGIDQAANQVARSDFFFILTRSGGELLALTATITIFLIVVYFESVRLEIPLAHAAVRGARGKFPVKLLYVSNIPIILIGTLQANIQILGTVFANRFPALGSYVNVGSNPTAVNGPLYYLGTINGPEDWLPLFVHSNLDPLRSQLGMPPLNDWQIYLKLVLYAIILIGGSIMFSIFWVQTTGMGPREIAKQVQSSGMQIPGFRRESVSIERVMERYIPKVTILGGAIVGALVLFGSLLGTIGGVSPTGLLLSVGIIYHLYEALAKEQVMEMHPLFRRFIGEG